MTAVSALQRYSDRLHGAVINYRTASLGFPISFGFQYRAVGDSTVTPVTPLTAVERDVSLSLPPILERIREEVSQTRAAMISQCNTSPCHEC